MTCNIIQPVAKRLFDCYVRYCDQSGLEDLQYLTEEAYKLHERLRKQPGCKGGLYGLNEFLLLKALRNYSVHQGEFIGEAFRIRRSLAESLKLDLIRVCLVKKETINKAINFEPRLQNDADELVKVKRVNSQLVVFGDYYNLEPVIFNFMVKVYELLTQLSFSIPGIGFQEFDTLYKREAHYNYKHYTPLFPVNIDSKVLLDNLIPIADSSHPEVGIPEIDEDPYKSIGTLKVNCGSYELMEYGDSTYELFSSSVLRILARDKNSYTVAMGVPHHIGVAIISDDTKGNITGFNINQQLSLLRQHGIELDDAYLDFGADEVLVLSFIKNQIWPVVISKYELREFWNSQNKQAPAMDGDGKRTKAAIKNNTRLKQKRKAVAKARKLQRKRK